MISPWTMLFWLVVFVMLAVLKSSFGFFLLIAVVVAYFAKDRP